jgi:hypothetical protein
MLEQFAKAFGGLSAQIITLVSKVLAVSARSRPELYRLHCSAQPCSMAARLLIESTSPLMKRSSASSRFCMSARTSLLPGQMLFQTLKTLIVIAHLRAEKNLANAIDLAGHRQSCYSPGTFISHWVVQIRGP